MYAHTYQWPSSLRQSFLGMPIRPTQSPVPQWISDPVLLTIELIHPIFLCPHPPGHYEEHMRKTKKSIQPRISYFIAMSSTTKQHLQFISPELKIPYILWIEVSSWTLFFSVLTYIFGLCWRHLKYIDKVPAITFPSPAKALSMCSSFYIDCYGTFWSLNGHWGIL